MILIDDTAMFTLTPPLACAPRCYACAGEAPRGALRMRKTRAHALRARATARVLERSPAYVAGAGALALRALYATRFIFMPCRRLILRPRHAMAVAASAAPRHAATDATCYAATPPATP